MKNVILFILFIFLVSAMITDRSTQQVVISDRDLPRLKASMTSYFKLGYRVVSMAGQSVSYTPAMHEGYVMDPVDIRGEVIVVMEK